MEKRISQRSSGKLLAAAVASVGLAGFAASQADAGLLVDIRAASINGINLANQVPDPNHEISGDRKAMTVTVGDTITFNVVVRVSGTNATQTVGNFDNSGPTTDTRNDDTIQALVGAFNSVGTLKGDMLGGANANQANGNQVFPWGAPGSQNGVAQDFDSDGDLDLGATGTDPTNMWVARAGAQEIPTVGKKTTLPQTRFGLSIAGATGGSAAFTEDAGGSVGAQPDTAIIDPTSAETLLGEITMVVTGGVGATNINFVPRANADAGALWFEDGITTGKNGTNSPFFVGAPLNVQVVPEPATLGLMGLASLGLLARRRKQA
jgi:hypothetical protein